MPADRPLPYAESILPFLDAYRKVLHVPSNQATIDRLPARGTLLSACITSGLVDGNGCTTAELAYGYSHAEGTRAISSNLMTLFFVQSRTGNTAYTPVLTHGGAEVYDWPDEIRRALFSNDPNIPLTVTALNAQSRGVAVLPRWFLDLDRNPGPRGKWPCKVNHYLGSDPFPQNAFGRDPYPDEGEIAWDLAGHSDRIRGLHDKTRVPVQSGSYATQIGGVTGYLGGAQQWRPVAATRMRRWSEFTYDDQMQFVDGLWHWIQIIMEAPPRRKSSPQTISI